MKRIIAYILLLGAALLMPVKRADVGKLMPVELVHIYKEGNYITIATDTGAGGTGKTVHAAVENLKSTTAGIIYLDTARYLLTEENMAEELAAIRTYLKPMVRVCTVRRNVDLKKAASYLAVHTPHCRLRDLMNGQEAEMLRVENGKMVLKEI